MRLRPWQAAALCELHDHGGLFAQAGVGMGKTLVTYLAAVVLGAKRPLLLVPAKLKAKTIRDFHELAKHFRGVSIRVESYELLGRADKHGEARIDLEKYRPDLLMCDEGHKLSNPKAARTRRMKRFIRETCKAGLSIQVMVMSGTIAKRSLRDFAHILEWCHPGRSPLPHDDMDLIFWADAVDERPHAPDPVDPGALLQMCSSEERTLEPLEAARRAVGRRIFETPGCMATRRAEGVDCSLVIECHERIVGKSTEDAFRHLKSTWSTPDQWPVSDGMSMVRHCRELGNDFFLRWDPRPPLPWIYARAAWCAEVREVLGTNRHGLDSEFQVALEVSNAIKKGKPHRAADVYKEWRELEPSFTPHTVPVWLDDAALRWAAQWAEHEPGLVWVENVCTGEALSEMTGLPYYRHEGKDDKGRYIEDHKPGRSGIASMASCDEGMNLQGIWSRALFMSFPPTGRKAEQTLGRLHRPGQRADEVVCDVLISCREQYTGFLQAINDAGFANSVLQSEMKLWTTGPESPRIKSVDEEKNVGNSADIITPPFKAEGWSWLPPQRNKPKAA